MAKHKRNARRNSGSGADASSKSASSRRPLVIMVKFVSAIVVVGVLWTASSVFESKKRILIEIYLREFGMHLYESHDTHGSFPNRDRFKQMSPELLEELEQRYVILWNALDTSIPELSDNNLELTDILVAYEKQADKTGGYALFLDADTKDLSAEELTSQLMAHKERSEQKLAQAEAEEKLRDPSGKSFDPVKAIESLGGAVELTSNFNYVQLDSLRCEDIEDADLVHLSKLANLQMIDLGGANVTDVGLQHLSKLVTLEQLYLQRTHVAGPGLRHIAQMRLLTHLLLNDTQVGNEGLEHLQGLTNLETLNLDDTKVSNAGLAFLKGMTNLTRLDLNFTNISDEGVEHLAHLKNLKALFLL